MSLLCSTSNLYKCIMIFCWIPLLLLSAILHFILKKLNCIYIYIFTKLVLWLQALFDCMSTFTLYLFCKIADLIRKYFLLIPGIISFKRKIINRCVLSILVLKSIQLILRLTSCLDFSLRSWLLLLMYSVPKKIDIPKWKIF